GSVPAPFSLRRLILRAFRLHRSCCAANNDESMKFRCSKHSECASTLMVTLFMVGLLGFFLFAYLYLVRTQRGFVARSQGWNAALAMAEAGVEEALAQLNPGASVET